MWTADTLQPPSQDDLAFFSAGCTVKFILILSSPRGFAVRQWINTIPPIFPLKKLAQNKIELTHLLFISKPHWIQNILTTHNVAPCSHILNNFPLQLWIEAAEKLRITVLKCSVHCRDTLLYSRHHRMIQHIFLLAVPSNLYTCKLHTVMASLLLL
jgi:hypothetical protein